MTTDAIVQIKPKIGLCMIVKNESLCIERLLKNVAPLIDRYTIVDTGSTDGTQQIIRDVTESLGIPGDVHERPWVNFGHNRSEAIDLARDHSEYLLFMDADDLLVLEDSVADVRKRLLELDHSSYNVQIRHGSLTYTRVVLVRTDLPWRYFGVLHEYVGLPPSIKNPGDRRFQGVFIDYNVGGLGYRSRTKSKSSDDAHVLEKALREDPSNARNWYYLARSWEGAGEPYRAVDAYRQRASMVNGWDQERWGAQYAMAKVMDFNRFPDGSVIDAYLKAYDMRPNRAEPLVWLAAFFRYRKCYPSALTFIQQAMAITDWGDDIHFVERDCYGWRRQLEYGRILRGLLETNYKLRSKEELQHDIVASFKSVLAHSSQLNQSIRDEVVSELSKYETV